MLHKLLVASILVALLLLPTVPEAGAGYEINCKQHVYVQDIEGYLNVRV